MKQTHSAGNASRAAVASSSQNKDQRLLAAVAENAGIRIGGSAPWDIRVKDAAFYQAVFSKWSLGLGESYMDGHWECDRIDELIARLMRCDINQLELGWSRVRLLHGVLRAKLQNLQSRERAFQVGERHYDIGNDVFEQMLDPHMVYSCGYWENANNLEEAQLQKMDMICRKLQLKPGERLLEIGCGWGGLMAFAAKHYGVNALGITVSREQRSLALQRHKGLPLRIELVDYRDLQGEFDKIVSVGMFEHVGAKNYRAYFDVAKRVLKPDGLFLLHTIGNDTTTAKAEPWIDKYIFPNGKLPSAKEIARSLEGKFIVEDWHNFGQDYDRTLMAWHENFERAWPRLAPKYGERFRRMWKYYLLSCAGFFRSRQGQLWQIVLSKREKSGQYRSFRFADGLATAPARRQACA